MILADVKGEPHHSRTHLGGGMMVASENKRRCKQPAVCEIAHIQPDPCRFSSFRVLFLARTQGELLTRR
jgi:hypothetical protein